MPLAVVLIPPDAVAVGPVVVEPLVGAAPMAVIADSGTGVPLINKVGVPLLFS